MLQISNMIQNDVIMHESVVEYCNRVNSRLVVIKFNTACWNQYWEYSGIYIKRLFIMLQISNMIQNDVINLESVVEYYNRLNSLLLVIKFNAACWNQYWEYSGIYIKRLFIMLQISNMIQNDVIKLESVVEYCNRVIHYFLWLNSMQHVEINTGIILEYI